MPYADWGTDLYVGRETTVDLYDSEMDVFDPLSVTNANHLWHRGYPVEYLRQRHEIKHCGKTTRKVLIQADLWDGDPDVDVTRKAGRPRDLEDIDKLRILKASRPMADDSRDRGSTWEQGWEGLKYRWKNQSKQMYQPIHRQ